MKPSEKLKDWIDLQLSTREPGYAFPSERRLAADFNLAVITINRILSAYAKEGKVVRVRGKGTYIPDSEGAIPPVYGEIRSSADSIFEELRDAIANGDYKRGEALPQMKYMAIKFKVNYRTIISAYRKLVRDGMAHQIGKTYWVGTAREVLSNRDNREIWMFTHEPDPYTGAFINDMGLAYQKLEKEFHHHGFVIRYGSNDQVASRLKAWKKSGRMPAGLVFIRITWPVSETLFGTLKRNLPRLPTERPPILLDLQAAKYHGDFGKVHMFTRGHILTSASRAMADFIRRKKYKKVVMFLHADDFVWTVEGHALALYRIPWIARDHGVSPEFRLIVSPGTSDPKGRTVHLRKKLPHSIGIYAARKYNASDEHFAEELRLNTMVTRDRTGEFKGAVGPDTLWVFDSDLHAAEAIHWARSEGVRIPEDLSVIGLKHDPRCFHLGLSYCGPDWDTLGYQMAHSVIGDIPVARTGRGFIRSRALVIEKLTTR